MKFSLGLLTGAAITALAAYATGGTWRTLFVLGFALPILIAVIYPRTIASFLLRIASAKDAFHGASVAKSVNVKPGKTNAVVAIDEAEQEDADWQEYKTIPRGKRKKIEEQMFDAYEQAKARKAELAERRTA